MLKQLAFALVGSAVLAGPALAQTATTTKSTTTTAPVTTTAPNANGTTGQFITQEQAGQWRASKLRGLNVYNNNNEKIGDIDELLVDSTGKIQAVVLGVGGFLGMGEHEVAVPFDQIKFSNETRREAKREARNESKGESRSVETTASTDARPAPERAIFNATKEQLKAAPQFKFAK